MATRPRIVFSPHAREKIARLRHLRITEEVVSSILRNPDKVEEGYMNRKIAQGAIGAEHLVRIVFEETDNMLLVITVYPAGRRRYRM